MCPRNISRRSPLSPVAAPLPRLAAVLVIAVAGTFAVSQASLAQPPQMTGLEMAVAVEQVLVEVIARSEKSVVAIARVSNREGSASGGTVQPFLPRRSSDPTDPDFVPKAYGTGVVVDERGLILTQYHLLDPKDEHWVTTADRKTYRAEIRGADPRSGLAVLSIEATDLTPITLGDAGKLRKGQIVITLGNPYAIARDGQASASWGIVSNIARKAAPDESAQAASGKNTLHHFGTLIQTDAKLNLGTSGGALLNLKGEMVGLTTSVAAIAGYETPAGYAVPVDDAFRRVIEILKQGKEVEYGLLGVRPTNLPRTDKERGLRGIRVGDVIPGTPAEQVGLEEYDVITHVNGKPIYDADGLVLEVGRLPAAAEVRLTLLREGNRRSVDVKLAKYPVPGDKVVTAEARRWRGLTVDWPTAIPDYENYARLGEVDLDGCVAVASVEEGSSAWEAGLRTAMFISHVGSRRVTTPDEFFEAVARRRDPVQVRLTLPERENPRRTIAP